MQPGVLLLHMNVPTIVFSLNTEEEITVEKTNKLKQTIKLKTPNQTNKKNKQKTQYKNKQTKPKPNQTIQSCRIECSSFSVSRIMNVFSSVISQEQETLLLPKPS